MTYTTARIFTHVQATPEATWVIPHNLSTSYPIVTTWIDDGGVVTFNEKIALIFANGAGKVVYYATILHAHNSSTC